MQRILCFIASFIAVVTGVLQQWNATACTVINASLTQNQCLQCVAPPLTHVEMPPTRDATELNNDGMIKFVDDHYQTEPNLSILPKEI